MQRLNLNSDINVLLEAFESDREATLADIYRTYRSSFLSYSRRLSDDEELTIDCFQEAVISLYENLAIGKVTDQKSTVQTYLYAIGKHKILNAQKKKKTQLKLVMEQAESEEQQKEADEATFKKELIAKSFDQLGQKCRDILLKFYYQRYSVEAIMVSMNYKNENTVKAHKSRCLAQLREIVMNIKEI